MNNKLTDLEWTTCWMSVRYAMQRQSIASATLPKQLVSEYGNRWTKQQMAMLDRDLKDIEVFGDARLDNPVWQKFRAFLDYEHYFEVIDNFGKEHQVFEYEDEMIPVKKYIDNPYQHIYIPLSEIFEIIK